VGRVSVTDEERSGRSATSRTEENTAKVCQILRENGWLTVRSIAEQVNIDRERVRKILTEDLDMRKVCAKMVKKELTKEHRLSVLEHPPYSPDLANNDFLLFPKIKETMKGRHFDDTDDIRRNMMAALKAIPQNQFQNCFEG
jgi:hypothetical protein